VRLALRETATAARRAPLLTALAIITIGFSLYAFGLFGLVALNIRQAIRSVEERVEIRAFLRDSTSIYSVDSAMATIGKYPEVARVEYVSQESALDRARSEMGEFTDVFDQAVLPASIEVHMRAGLRSTETVNAVSKRIAQFPIVDDVRYGEEWVGKLYRLRTIASFVGIALGLAFAAVATIIIGATIRMTVLARAKEISVMRLVGATDAFVRRPFLIDGLIKGVLGGVLALIMTWATHKAVNEYFFQTVFFDKRLMLLGLVAGAFIGVAGSMISVGRQLRQI
jgi:cell division transport system permease protein